MSDFQQLGGALLVVGLVGGALVGRSGVQGVGPIFTYWVMGCGAMVIVSMLAVGVYFGSGRGSLDAVAVAFLSIFSATAFLPGIFGWTLGIVLGRLSAL